uniref:Uncharacterized protein n=1 Tax=Anguilla anguilla TaxID=7936 RepID=A0A0E9QV75_ANGAN
MTGRYAILPSYGLVGQRAPYLFSTESLALFRVPTKITTVTTDSQPVKTLISVSSDPINQ